MASPDVNANLVDKSECVTLIVDGQGKIHGCDAAVENLFGTGHGVLIGQAVSAFIVGILFEGNTPGDNARQLARLCANHDWQKFEALSADGNGFSIEVNTARKITNGQEVFVLNLRRPGDMSCR
jgi:PAS domain-containing protein